MRVATLRHGPVLLRWAAVPARPPRLDPSLGTTQAARAAGLHGDRLAAFLTTRALVAALLRELAPSHPPELDSACEACGAQHGPLRAVHAPVLVSTSSSGTWAMAAAALRSDVVALGVDVEAGPDRVLADLAGMFAPRPAPTLADWVRVEAALKADGRGLRVPPDEVCLDGEHATLPDADPVRVVPVDGPSGTLSALAYRRA